MSGDHVVRTPNPIRHSAGSGAEEGDPHADDSPVSIDSCRDRMSIDMTLQRPSTKKAEASKVKKETNFNCCGCCDEEVPIELERSFSFAEGQSTVDGPPAMYSRNAIYTNQYNWITFLPVNLMQQFAREANMYFLFIAILSSISIISPASPITSIAPLLLVLGVTLIKDGYDDLGRRRADEFLNKSAAHVLRDGQLCQVAWQDLEVGQIVQLQDGDPIPADMILISAQSHVDISSAQNLSGAAEVDTAQLDGETNLKAKYALPETSHLLTIEHILLHFKGDLRCDPPNESLTGFNGQLLLSGSKQAAGLGMNQMLLRGSTLRNAVMAWGLVTHCGPQTKIQMNLDREPNKKLSMVEAEMNIQVRFMLVVLCILCLTAAIAGGVWLASDGEDAWYLALVGFDNPIAFDPDKTEISAVLLFFTTIILLNTLVPISLYVNVELLKLIVSWWIDWDLEMYHPQVDKAAKTRNTSITEELGQIQYVLSDKTGTLTQNKMELLRIVVDGTEYGEAVTEIELAEARDSGVEIKEPVRPSFVHEEKFKDCGFFDNRVNELRWKTASDSAAQHRFWLALALCNQVRPEKKEDGMHYHAGNPDDGALVCGAESIGMVMLSAEPMEGERTRIVIGERQPDGVLAEVVYEQLTRIEFSSDRKRMSVLVKFPDDTFWLICKGADSMVLSLLQNESDPMVQDTVRQINNCANLGLRTLLIGQRQLSVEEVSTWQTEFASNSKLPDMKEVKKAQLALGQSLERDLEIVGGTAIEDKLQENVGETLQSLRDADVRTWVLTGDKVDTAIRIGHACKLLTGQMDTVVLQEKVLTDQGMKCRSAREIVDLLQAAYADYKLKIESQQKLQDASTNVERQQLARQMSSAMQESDRRQTTDNRQLSSPQAYDEQVDLLAKGEAMLDFAVVVDGAALEKLGIGVKQPNGIVLRLLKDCRKILTELKEAHPWSDNSSYEHLLAALVPRGSDWLLLGSKSIDSTLKELNGLVEASAECIRDWRCSQPAGTSPGALHTGLKAAHRILQEALYVAPNVAAWQLEFIQICGECAVVLCCRVSPMQKADVTALVKQNLGVTLAIGDGANDVNMILEAHVGVGICGVEGTSAVNNADYAIPQFKNLSRLMLVHGRLCYLRIGTLICYFFYKNFLFTMCSFMFNCYCTFSGQYMFNEWAVLEMDVGTEQSVQHPELYHVGPRCELFNSKVFIRWIAEGMWGAIVCFFVPFYALSNPDADGLMLEMWGEGTAIMTAVICTVTARICMETTYWTWVHVVAYSLSLLSWFAFLAVLSLITYTGSASSSGDSSSYGINRMISKQVIYWLLALSSTVFSLAPTFIYQAFCNALIPSTQHLVRSFALLGDEDPSEEFLEQSQDVIYFQESPDQPAASPAESRSTLGARVSRRLTQPFNALSRRLTRRTTRSVAAGFAVPSARMTLDMTNTYDAIPEEEEAGHQRIQRLLKTTSVTRLSKRWVKRFRARKALREGRDNVAVF